MTPEQRPKVAYGDIVRPALGAAGRRGQAAKGLHGVVVDGIGRAIVENRIVPGTLLNADELTRTFGVSRSVVRECVRVLESMGLVQARPHVGTRVLTRENWDLLDPRIIDWYADSPGSARQRQELLELRSGIEPMAARLAATAVVPADALEEMGDCCGVMADAWRRRDKAAYFRADIRFHVLMLHHCGNDVIRQLAHTVAAALASRYVEETFFRDPSTPASVKRHRHLVVQLTARDASASEQAAREIVDQTLIEVGPA
ncbi:FCD domain-containing protein [Streptomyces sp. NPDC051322]|uniref:FadR/GntR family transcriptional regulator n=1 Tax=Streptomyces sp. NPDC051322 TaxID=3154645 RepID=UPI00344D24DC